ncbi:hypothetical protein HanOQP8_Chr17g0683621 [Helianthus annuus]|nr:hypothetical protein HanHA89_Chr17g0730481 [Helianthus annuus]KAJ0638288.1 hypothetical protein HanOQP8_Chr17g0683621 [Helianthus annuus]KAJ0815512.1 hypothetical protein HanPSC8_Chr17g0798391 [Helianthus annuus]
MPAPLFFGDRWSRFLFRQDTPSIQESSDGGGGIRWLKHRSRERLARVRERNGRGAVFWRRIRRRRWCLGLGRSMGLWRVVMEVVAEMWGWRRWWRRCGGGGGGRDAESGGGECCVLKERRGEKRWAYVCVEKRWGRGKR